MKKIVIILIGLALVISGIIFIPKFLKGKNSNSSSQSNGEQNSQVGSPLPTPTTIPFSQTKSTLGIVLLGYGGAGHSGGYLTDAIQVLYVDFKKPSISLISIPRDLWVKLPGGEQTKINAAMVSGGKNANSKEFFQTGTNTLKGLIFDITGLTMNYFISVDFVGFQRAIGENLKTIDIDVHETLDDPWYPITGKELDTCGLTGEEINELMTKYSGFELEKQFPCRYEHLHFPPGLTKMQAGVALKYARSRHGSSDGDIARGRRAQEIIMAIGKKLFSLNTLDDIQKYYKLFTKNVQTDINLETAEYLGPFIKSAKDFKVTSINLSTTNVLTLSSINGQSIVVPKTGMFKWDEIKSYISSQMN